MTQPTSAPATPSPVEDAGNGMTTQQAEVEQTRARAGLAAVVFGDIVIALATILAVYHFASGKDASNTAMVSVLTSAFTAIGTMTTAYFGIKAASNTAQTSLLTSPQQAGSRTTARP